MNPYLVPPVPTGTNRTEQVSYAFQAASAAFDAVAKQMERRFEDALNEAMAQSHSTPAQTASLSATRQNTLGQASAQAHRGPVQATNPFATRQDSQEQAIAQGHRTPADTVSAVAMSQGVSGAHHGAMGPVWGLRMVAPGALAAEAAGTKVAFEEKGGVVVPEPAGDGASGVERWRSLIDDVSARHGVNARLLERVMAQESGGNPMARSAAGALGLMQLMPATARELGITDALDPAQNLDGGARYLKQMLERFSGDLPLAVAAYNAGPGQVVHYGGIPPFPETRQYVARILGTALEP